MSLQRSNRKAMNIAPVIYSLSCEIELMGNGYLTTGQTYDSFGPTYAPDYTIDSPNLFPRCQLVNPDSPVAAVVCNKDLSSFEWMEVTSRGKSVIYSGGETASGYRVVTDGEYRGQLVVRKNGEAGMPRVVRFVGYITKDGYTYKFERDYPLPCSDVSSSGVELSIDSGKAMAYYPLRMPRNQTITAKVVKGDKDVTNDERVKLVWFRRSESGTETQLTANNDMENVEISAVTRSKNGSIISLTIDRELIGEEQTYVVYAMYRSDKVFPSSPQKEDARQYTTISRQFRQIQVEIQGDGVRSNTGAFHVRAILSDNQGVLENWQELLYVSWKVSDGTSEKEVARGEEAMITLDEGKSFFCDVEDRGTLKALTSDSGAWLLDDSGNPVVARDYVGG